MLQRYVLGLGVLVVSFLVPQQVLAEGHMWGNDVLVHQANHIYGFGMDQGDKDTLYLVVADSSTTNSTDTTYVYRSTNNGRNWSYGWKSYSGRRGKADIIAAKGDLDAVYIFEIIGKRLVCARHSYDLTGLHFGEYISDVGENVVDVEVCQDLFPNYWLYVVYQTDQDSVIFKRSRNFDTTWTERKNLTEITPITSQPSIAYSRGPYLVVAGKTDNNKICAIRNVNYGNSADWQDGQNPWECDDCHSPVVAGSHTSPDSEAVFWVFYHRWVTSPTPHYILNYRYSTDAGSTWSFLWSPLDTSSGSRVFPSLHVLKENDVSDLTLGYRYEGTSPHQIRYIYQENAQSSPHVFRASYSGVNDYNPVALPHQKAYTIRDTDNSIISAVLYVNTSHHLYFDASPLTDVDDETGDEPVSGFSLTQNYPNPFNPATNIEFLLSKSGPVKIEIFNILSEKVRTLLDQHLKAGQQMVHWDGKDDSGDKVASGVYFYRLQTEDFTETKKMVLIR